MHMDPSLLIAGVLLLGVACQWLAWRVKLPAILPLLFAGLALGPLLGWLQPEEDLGSLYAPLVSLSVAIILFEGSLTLSWRELRHVMGPVRNLLTVGALIHWLGGALAARYIMGMAWDLALLFGALIIVTGPTVIAPLLRNVRPNRSISSVLRWEGILIDPIGATVAVLVFEAIVARTAVLAGGVGSGLLDFLRILTIGGALGLAAAYALAAALRRFWLPDYLRDVTVLSLVVAVFALANALAHESGLTAVTVMGIFLANANVKQVQEVLNFKEKLSVLLISTLFLLLAANVSRADLALLDWRSLLLLGVVMLVLRPLGVWLSTLRSSLSRNERLFLAWIAPRGIVAASISSLFAYRLVELGRADAAVIAPLIFLVIVGTVLVQGLTAKPLARRLGVAEADPQGVLLMGAGPFARELARALGRTGISARLVDANRANVIQARLAGLDAVHGNILSQGVEDDLDLSGLGRLLALTENDEANALACRHFAEAFGSSRVYQLPPQLPTSEGHAPNEPRLGRLLFAAGATPPDLAARLERGAAVKVTPLTDKYTWEDFQRDGGAQSLPLLAVRGGSLTVATVDKPLKPTPGGAVVALSG